MVRKNVTVATKVREKRANKMTLPKLPLLTLLPKRVARKVLKRFVMTTKQKKKMMTKILMIDPLIF